MKKKSFILNSFYLIVYRVLAVVFPLVTASYTSFILGPSGIGKVASAQNLVSYFIVFSGMGIVNYGTREIAKCRNDLVARNQVFSEIQLLNIIISTLMSLVFLVVISSVEKYRSDFSLFCAVGIMIFSSFLNVDWVYQGFEEYRFIAIRSTILRVISICFVFLLIKSSEDYIRYGLIIGLTTLLNHIVNFVALKGSLKLSFSHLSLLRHIKPILIMSGMCIAIELYTLFDITVLNFMSNAESVGYYSNASKISKLIITLLSSISTVMFPQFSIMYKEQRADELSSLIDKSVKVLLFFSFPATIGLFVLSPQIILALYGSEFIPSITTLKILSFLIIPITFSTMIGSHVLCAFGKEGKKLFSVVAGAIINLILNFTLIRVYLHNGVAIASVVSELIVLIIDCIVLNKIIRIKLNFVFLGKVFLSSTIMFFGVSLTSNIFSNTIISLFASILCGVLLYFLSSIMFKNEIVIMLYDMVKKKKEKHV